MHQAVLEYVEASVRDDAELPDPAVEITLVEKIESGTFAITPFELERLRVTSEHHAGDESTPERDRAPSRAVVRRIDRRCRGTRLR